MSERDRKDNALVRKLMARPPKRASLIGGSTGSGSNPADRNSFDNPMTDPGDMIQGGIGGQPKRIPFGAEGQVPTVQADGFVLFADPTGSGGSSSPDPYPMGFYAKVPSSLGGIVEVGPVQTFGNTGGTLLDNDDSAGPWSGLSTTTNQGVGSDTSVSFAHGARRSWGPILRSRVRIVDAASVRIWVGFTAVDPSGSATPPVHTAAFRYDTGAGDTTWQAVAKGATTNTVTNTGITVGAGDLFVLEVQLFANRAEYYIDDVLVATISTDLPSSAQPLAYHIWLTALSGTKALDWGYMVLWPLGRGTSGGGGGGGGVTLLNELDDVNAPSPDDGDALIYDAASGLWIPGAVTPPVQRVSIPWNLDEGGVPSSGQKAIFQIPFLATIVDWMLLGDTAGDITIEPKVATYAAYPTFTSLSGAGTKPILAAAQKATMANLTSWTTSIIANSFVTIDVSGAADLAFAHFSLIVERA